MKNQLTIAKQLAYLLDNRFQILGVKFGLGAIFELIPAGIGDGLATVFSLYVIFIAAQNRVPGSVISRMIFNVVITFIAGLIPVVGEAFYIFYKPNTRNVELLIKYQPLLVNSE